MGGAKPKSKKKDGQVVAVYGSLDQASKTLRPSERGVIKGALLGAFLAIGTILFPQFAFAIYAAYYAYVVARHALEMKQDYDNAKGTPEERTVTMAVKEGFRVGIGAAIGAGVGELAGKPLHEAVKESVHVTADKLGEAGMFTIIATATGGTPNEEDELRYLYTATATRVAEGAMKGAEDEISQYITEEVVK